MIISFLKDGQGLGKSNQGRTNIIEVGEIYPAF